MNKIKLVSLLDETKLPTELKKKLPRDSNPSVTSPPSAIKDILETFKTEPLSVRQIMVAVYNKHKIIVSRPCIYNTTSLMRKKKLLKSNNSKHQLV